MNLIRDALIVFVGAGLGGVCRWGIGTLVAAVLGATRFPLAAFLSNLVACALVGIVAGLSLREGSTLSVPVRLLLVTGFLGGLSTMSAFGLETVALLRRGDLWIAGINILLTLVACLGALWLILRAVES